MPSTKERIPIPLVERKIRSTETLKVKLRTNPGRATVVANADANAGQYEITFKRADAFDSGEEYIRWRFMIDEVVHHMPLTTLEAYVQWAGTLLTQKAQETWNTLVFEHDMTTAEGVKAAMEAVTVVAMGTTGWKEQYLYMRELKKPKDTRVVHFAQRLQTMAVNISLCTGPQLSLTAEDLKHMLVQACPDSYMRALGASFTVADKTYHELVEYLDWAEAAQFENRPPLSNVQQRAGDQQQRGDRRRGRRCQRGERHNQDASSAPSSQQQQGTRPICPHCNKAGHVEANCWEKYPELRPNRRQRQRGNRQDNQQVRVVEATATSTRSSADTDSQASQLIEALDGLIEPSSEAEVSVKASLLALFPFTKTRRPLLTNDTTPADLVTEVVVLVKGDSKHGQQPVTLTKVLLDTGCSCTIIRREFVLDALFQEAKTVKETMWHTNGGPFLTRHEMPLSFSLPEFTTTKEITWDVKVDETKLDNMPYSMIVGRDLMAALGMDIMFSTRQLVWDGQIVPMRLTSQVPEEPKQQLDKIQRTVEELFAESGEGEAVKEVMDRVKRILDAKYEKANIDEFVGSMDHLDAGQKHKLKKLLLPILKKVEAIRRIQAPTTVKQLRSFLGMVNYYQDMWKGCSHILAPLSALTKLKPKEKFQWGKKEQQAFERAKQAIAADVMLSFPDFSKPFHLHADSSDYQLGGAITQEDRPIAFFSRKLTPTQQRYTIGEREMLGIVETLKEYRNILLGHQIYIYTDHLNNINPTTKHASHRLERWRLLIEEFAPTFVYVKGEDNVVADALSRLERMEEEDSAERSPEEELRLIANGLIELEGDFAVDFRDDGFDNDIDEVEDELGQLQASTGKLDARDIISNGISSYCEGASSG